MPSTDDADDNEASAASDDPEAQPTPLPMLFVRPTLEAWFGLLLASTGFHGWWYVLTSDYLSGYSLPAMMWDLSLLFVGLLALAVGVGRAVERLELG